LLEGTLSIKEVMLVDRKLTKAYSGWPQRSGDNSKTFTTAEAQADYEAVGVVCFSSRLDKEKWLALLIMMLCGMTDKMPA
jgi:hypothetical protein